MLAPFDHRAFIELSGPWKPAQRAGFATVVEFIAADPLITLTTEAAYLLATVQHECAGTWQPIREWGTAEYFQKYDRPPLSLILGNKQKGDGARYCGRGYGMITGLGNYMKFSGLLACNFVHNPEAALVPKNAYAILSTGVLKGQFTGKRLGLYINESKTDYVNSRRTVNGLDRAELIASYATRFAGIFQQLAAPSDTELHSV